MTMAVMMNYGDGDGDDAGGAGDCDGDGNGGRGGDGDGNCDGDGDKEEGSLEPFLSRMTLGIFACHLPVAPDFDSPWRKCFADEAEGPPCAAPAQERPRSLHGATIAHSP